MIRHTYVILGGGPAAGYAAQEFVQQGIKPGELALVSSDEHVPYDRPPLSKGYLQGTKREEDIFIGAPAFYEDHGIKLYLGTEAVAVDSGDGSIETADGERIHCDKLLIATGASVRHLDVPGADDCDIRYFRSLTDARGVRDAAKDAQSALVLGGGFIGMEVASSLAMRGMDVRLVFPEAKLMQTIFTEPMAAFFASYYRAKGVEVLARGEVKRFRRSNGSWEALLDAGDAIPFDLVVAGVGVVPAVDALKKAGLHVDDGVHVNDYLETGIGGVYAAGDVARFPARHAGGTQRVTHWQNAKDQGRVAAKNLTGTRTPYNEVPYFFSDVFDLSWEYWGDNGDAEKAYHVGDIDNGAFSVWWVKNGLVTAGFTMGRVEAERERLVQCVRDRAELPRDIEQRGKQSL